MLCLRNYQLQPTPPKLGKLYLKLRLTVMEDNTAPDTSNFLDWVEIKNFKSIKDLRLDCKRVNIFIGKPNVGKSNILERTLNDFITT